MENVKTDKKINAKAIDTLHANLDGALLQPGDEQYNEASTAWNLHAKQHPALVVMATCTDDIIAAVQFARDANIGIGVMATGHGVGTPCDGGLLINTSKMCGVKIDPVTQTATVEAGALWKEVILEAYAHGLAGLQGSSPNVGVVGYTLGGGFSYLGRKYGLNAYGVTAADIVTADGKLKHVSEDENAELFWGLKGSAGNLGIVTSLEFKLYPLRTVYGGAVFYPVEHAQEALTLFARWTANIPDEVTAAFAFVNFPQLPTLPEPLRGRSVVIMRGCYCGEDPQHGEELFSPLRKELGKPIMDTFSILQVVEMDKITNDPVDPVGTLQYGCLLSDLTREAIQTLVKIEGAGSGSPLIFVELRRLGGALTGNAHDMHLMGNRNAQFSMGASGGTHTPEMVTQVSKHLSLLKDQTRPFQTGETFNNSLEVAPDIDRVRSAYTAEDWERLVALKTQYDPTNLFRFNRNIPPQV
jgi:UDP-N-acetylenolpyruvoylglucosamine reductase